MKKTMLLLLPILLIWIFASRLSACTTAVVSGKGTPDGRPLLFKHRDTKKPDNKLMFFADGKYPYIGLVNTDDSLSTQIWAGCNSAGFAVMNAASYNLNTNDTTRIKDREGFLMKTALQTCATLKDFETLLDTLPKPLGVEANFGVIDAQGGAAYYETGNFNYSKIDVNDPAVAPFGYVIRTNYSFTGERDEGYGYIRYAAAQDLFDTVAATNAITPEFLIQKVSRCLKHGLTQIDLTQSLPRDSNTPCFVPFEDYISRFSSASTVVVQGVKPEESVDGTTLWTVLGFQLCSVAVPVWLSGGAPLPPVLTGQPGDTAPLCDMALQLKKRCFPIQRGSGNKYLNLTAVLNEEQSGIFQKLQPLEAQIFQETQRRMVNWRKKGMPPQEIQRFYRWLDKTIRAEYQRKFDL